MSRIYLDNHTATKPFSEVIGEMMPLFRMHFASSTSPHSQGQEQFSVIESSLKKLYSHLGASEGHQFYFSSSGAEAISQVFHHAYHTIVRETGKNHFVTTNIEEAPILMSLNRLEEVGCATKMALVNSQGQLTADLLEPYLRPRTAMVSLSWANGMTGVINPIEDIARLCKEREIPLHIDGSYIIGKLFFRLADLPCDYFTFDGEKVHSPRGSAGTFVAGGKKFYPLVSGNPSVLTPQLFALASSIEELSEYFDHVCMETARLRTLFEEEILQAIPDAQVFFKEVERVPNTTVIAFKGIHADALLYLLDRKGVSASLGGGNFQKLSIILKACGIGEELASSALSFSLSYETTEQDIIKAASIVKECVALLRKSSSQLII